MSYPTVYTRNLRPGDRVLTRHVGDGMVVPDEAEGPRTEWRTVNDVRQHHIGVTWSVEFTDGTLSVTGPTGRWSARSGAGWSVAPEGWAHVCWTDDTTCSECSSKPVPTLGDVHKALLALIDQGVTVESIEWVLTHQLGHLRLS